MKTDYNPQGFALDIFKKRYALHADESWVEACERVATHVASAERGEKVIETREKFSKILRSNLFMPGGRIMYGSGRPKGQLLNCFVVPTEDSREGWGKTVSDMIVISSTGGGLGLNCSPIRPKGSPINGSGGTATGATSLMEIINSAGDVIKAGGGRRVALMLALSLNHGDIEEFLDKKLDLKRLNNANVSVIFDDDPEIFFDLVRSNSDLELKFNGKIIGKVPAKKIFDKIIKNALQGGEPGLLNGYLANKMNNVWYEKQLICTNPCITGDTLIAVADGRNAVSIKQLTEEGRDIPVYSTNVDTGKVEIKFGRNPRKTGIKSEVWKLTFDDGSVFRATPNHKILKKDLSYVELKDLKAGDSVFPFNSFDSNNYRQICSSGEKVGNFRRNRRQYRLIHEFFNGETNSKEFAIHHLDFNSRNDRIENLSVISHSEHKMIHSEMMIGDKNPYHKMSEEWKHSFASHPGKLNPRFSGHENEKLLHFGKKVLEENGKLTQELWIDFAKKNNLPQFLGNEFRFGSFTSFKNQVINNHKVVSVEFDCYEDVYNITVDDNHNYHVITSKEDDLFVTSSGFCVKNCGEIWLAPYDCCCLGALVLPKFVTESGIDWTLLKETVETSVRFLDNVLSVNNYPLPEIRQTCSDIRRIGLGIMGLHDMLLMLGMRYADPNSLEMIDKVMNFIKEAAYNASIDLAAEKGSFPKFDPEKYLKGGFAKTLRPKIRDRIKKFGIRNCALLTVAPTGTTSIVCDVTSALENTFGPAWKRRYWDNDVLKEEIVVHPLFKRMLLEKKDVSHFQNVHDLNIRDHFEVQRVCQRHIDNACSKTINVPQGVSAEELGELYMEFFPELKGVTVYPDGSRENQPIVPLSAAEALSLIDLSSNEESEGALSSDNCKSGFCEI